MTFAQLCNRLSTHFSGSIPVVKRHISILENSVFRRCVNEICALSELYSACNGRFVPTFRDNLSISGQAVQEEFFNPIFKVQADKSNSSLTPWILKMGLIVSPETLVRSYNSKLRKIPKKHRFCNIYSLSSQHVFVFVSCVMPNWSLVRHNTQSDKKRSPLH